MATNPYAVTKTTPSFNFGAQKQEADDYLSKYTSAISGMEGIPSMYNRISDQMGLGSLRDAYAKYGELADTLTGQIRGLPKALAGRSQESLLTEGQRARMVESEQAPLMEQFGDVSRAQEAIGTRLGQGEQVAGQLMSAEMAQQERSLLPFERGFDVMEQRQAREFSGYTFQQQQELDRLIANMNAGVQLSIAEKQRAHELSLAELQYKNALKQIREQGAQNESLAAVNALL